MSKKRAERKSKTGSKAHQHLHQVYATRAESQLKGTSAKSAQSEPQTVNDALASLVVRGSTTQLSLVVSAEEGAYIQRDMLKTLLITSLILTMLLVLYLLREQSWLQSTATQLAAWGGFSS